MQLQTIEIDGKTYALVSEGKPLYKGDDGKDVAFDASATIGTISRITEESKGFKQRAQTAEDGLKKFEVIKDPAAALKALETVANLDNKKLIDAGEAQRVRDEISNGYEGKLTESDKRYTDLLGRYNGEKVKGSFAGSKFIAEKVAVPIDMLQATFGAQFSVDENGQVVALGTDGKPVGSSKRFGEPADFEEAIERLIDAYPFKEHILKGTGAAGSGAQGGGGGGGGAKTLTRAQFDALPQHERAAKAKDGFKVVDPA
jgi:hypothetical protein